MCDKGCILSQQITINFNIYELNRLSGLIFYVSCCLGFSRFSSLLNRYSGSFSLSPLLLMHNTTVTQKRNAMSFQQKLSIELLTTRSGLNSN